MKCPACNVVDGCGGIAHSEIEGHCCRCIPQRVCVSLFIDTNVCDSDAWVDHENAISTVEASWFSIEVGCSRQYAGTLLCGETSIDFRIRFRRDEDTGVCFMCLESEALGYTYLEGGTPEQDLRVCVQMGGDYADTAIKRAECRAMEFEFPIDFYGSSGSIAISPAPYVEAIKRRPGLHCMFERVCITVFDGYEETVHHICENSEYNPETSWTFLKDDDPNQWVTIRVEDHDSTGDGVTTLSLRSWLNQYSDIEIVAEAECPDMRAEWELPDGAWIRIRGDKLNKCTDCKCYCECLCVTYVEDETTFTRGMACRQLSYDGCEEFWTIELNGREFRFSLQCLDCETPQTFLTLEAPYGTSLISSAAQPVICPDGLTAEWALDVGSVYVDCAPCGSECSLDELSVVVPCCPDTRVPVQLYATVLSSIGCSQLPDGTIIGMVQQGAAIGAATNCWTGKITVTLSGGPCIQEFSLACYEESDGITHNWRMIASDCASIDASLSSPICTIVSCDPLILEVTVTPVGCCDDGVGASVTLRITA